MRDYGTKTDNTAPLPSGILTADEDNDRFSELKNAVVTSGITLEVSGPSVDVQMLAQAMARYASGAVFCTDVGNADAYILVVTGTFVAPKAYFRGMRVGWMPGNTSTGASTLSAFSIGTKKLLRADGSNIGPGDVFANRYSEAWYDNTGDGGAGAFRLMPWAIPEAPPSGAAPLSGEGVTVDGTYHVSLNYPGLSAAAPVSADLFSFYSQSGTHHRVVTLASLISILQSGLSQLTLTNIAPTLVVEQRRANLATRVTITPGVWQKRPLSTLVVNQIAGASLNGSNQITLPAGTYRASFTGSASAGPYIHPYVTVITNQVTRLFNVTSGAQIAVGQSVDGTSTYTDSSPYFTSSGVTHFTLAATSVIELQTFATSSQSVTLLMSVANDYDIGAGNYHVEGRVEFTKEA